MERVNSLVCEIMMDRFRENGMLGSYFNINIKWLRISAIFLRFVLSQYRSFEGHVPYTHILRR
jgi:hypothetical protein